LPWQEAGQSTQLGIGEPLSGGGTGPPVRVTHVCAALQVLAPQRTPASCWAAPVSALGATARWPHDITQSKPAQTTHRAAMHELLDMSCARSTPTIGNDQE